MELFPKHRIKIEEELPASTQEAVNFLLKKNGIDVTNINNPVALSEAAIAFVIDGGGEAITTGVKGFLSLPFNCTIVAAEILADQAGSIVIDIWADTYANFPPTDAESITGSSPPTVSADTSYYSTDLSDWKVQLGKKTNLAFNVDSCATIEFCTLTLYVKKAT